MRKIERRRAPRQSEYVRFATWIRDGGVRRFGCCLVTGIAVAAVTPELSNEAQGGPTSEKLAPGATCIYNEKQRLRGCIYRQTPWRGGRRVWVVSEYCGLVIYGNTLRLTLQEGNTGVYGYALRMKRGLWRTYGGFVRAWSTSPPRWEILDRKKQRVGWARGRDGPAAGLASLLDDSCLER
jgi:hypothetical protein